ncbi:MAG: glycosyltransferase family 8 protein [bacterium]|nr:glycosyltransferase family 8 protein [bacterium]
MSDQYSTIKKYKGSIPIAFATNNAYLAALAVAIQSISDNSDDTYRYDIYILYNSQLNIEKAKRIKSTVKENIKIEFMNVDAVKKNRSFTSFGRFSEEAYYDLLVADLFTNLKKVLFLDCDLVVLKDVKELYDTDTSNYLLAGVQEYLEGQFILDYVRNTVNVETDTYFNSGVLVINCEKFRQENILEKTMSIHSNKERYIYRDQDYLNIACNGKVKYISDRWNVRCFMPESLVEEIKDPALIHYAGNRKPWYKGECILSEYFWMYAKKSAFYNELLVIRGE